nr:twin-arginine translocation signal domain-containing protein [Chloroflexota bacterium]
MDNDDRQTGYILSRREVLTLAGVAGAVMLTGCSTGGPSQTKGGRNATPALNDEAAKDPATIAEASAVAATAQNANTTTAIPDCVVRPETTEGPYYVDDDLTRSDIRADPGTGVRRDGAPLVLTFNVSQVSASGCSPLEGAKVEIWQCDALGVYSDVSDPGFSTRGQKWLRGTQVTDAAGQATFTTIYP